MIMREIFLRVFRRSNKGFVKSPDIAEPEFLILKPPVNSEIPEDKLDFLRSLIKDCYS